jgi:hypothetical protein
MMKLTLVESLQGSFSDLHKDVYGFRPRYCSTEQWNDAEYLQEQIDQLCVELEVVMAEEAAFELKAIAAFEVRVSALQELGAEGRKMAVKWLMDAEDVNGDFEYFCYLNHLPYGYFKELA